MSEFEEAVEQAVYGRLRAIGGSFSVEHGIGTHKRAALVSHCCAAKLEIMRAIKQMIDPNNTMNPAKVL